MPFPPQRAWSNELIFILKSVNFNGIATITGFTGKGKVNLVVFVHLSSILGNFGTQILIIDQLQIVRTVLTFEGMEKTGEGNLVGVQIEMITVLTQHKDLRWWGHIASGINEMMKSDPGNYLTFWRDKL